MKMNAPETAGILEAGQRLACRVVNRNAMPILGRFTAGMAMLAEGFHGGLQAGTGGKT